MNQRIEFGRIHLEMLNLHRVDRSYGDQPDGCFPPSDRGYDDRGWESFTRNRVVHVFLDIHRYVRCVVLL